MRDYTEPELEFYNELAGKFNVRFTVFASYSVCLKLGRSEKYPNLNFFVWTDSNKLTANPL